MSENIFLGHRVKKIDDCISPIPLFLFYTCHASSFFYMRFQEKKRDFSINVSLCWGAMLDFSRDFTWKILACLTGKIQVKGRQRKYVRGYVYLSVYVYVFVCMTMCYSIKSWMSARIRMYISVQCIYVKWLSYSLASHVCASVHTYVCKV